MRNFTASRGAVAGILKGHSSISAAVFSEIYSIALQNSSSHFLLFLAIGIPALCFSIMFLIKMTLFPRKCSKPETSNLQVGSSSECLVQQGKDEKTEPLFLSSSSSATLGSFYDADESSEVAMLLAEGEGAAQKKRRPMRGEDFTFMEAVIEADFWLLFLVFFVGVRSGVTVLNK